MEKWDSLITCITDRSDVLLNRMAQEAVFVEINVHRGKCAELIPKKANSQFLYQIDYCEYQHPIIYDDSVTLSNDIQEEYFHNIEHGFKHDPRVIIMSKFFKNAVEKSADESLDWVYKDANHSYEVAKKSQSLVAKGKERWILSGHDYGVRASFGVVQAVNEFLLKNNVYFSHLAREENIYDSWSVRKPLN